MCRVGKNHIYRYIQCIFGIFGTGITEYTVIYNVHIRFWPTLPMCAYLHFPQHCCCHCCHLSLIQERVGQIKRALPVVKIMGIARYHDTFTRSRKFGFSQEASESF